MFEIYIEYKKNREAMDWYDKNKYPLMEFTVWLEYYNDVQNIFNDIEK